MRTHVGCQTLLWLAMRALLVVNPKATAATRRARDALVETLSKHVALTEVCTERRGHAVDLARTAAESSFDVVIALGGDGTVNEVVNGLLTDGPDPALPRLAVVPCGLANVFARSLGVPNRPLAAIETLLDALRVGRRRSVSMGVADGRYFTFCAGMGFDAAVVRIVESRRAAGRRSTSFLYVRSALRHFATGTDRRRPAIQLHLPGGIEPTRVFLFIVTNTSPWTYLGAHPISPTPQAGFDSGLDVFGMSVFRIVPVFRSVLRLLAGSDRVADRRWAVSLHDLSEFAASAPEPVDFQLDGEYLGRRTQVRFRSVPDALQVAI
jgi:diacylglycerol kinase family enzyme